MFFPKYLSTGLSYSHLEAKIFRSLKCVLMMENILVMITYSTYLLIFLRMNLTVCFLCLVSNKTCLLINPVPLISVSIPK